MATSRGSRGCSQIASAPGATDRAVLMCGDRGSEDVSREMCSILDRSRRQFEYTLYRNLGARRPQTPRQPASAACMQPAALLVRPSRVPTAAACCISKLRRSAKIRFLRMPCCSAARAYARLPVASSRFSSDSPLRGVGKKARNGAKNLLSLLV